MNTQRYRLIRGKLHRVNATAPTRYDTILPGTIFVPTDDELRLYVSNFECPLAAEPDPAVALDQAAPLILPTLDERAARDLAMNPTALRDVVRLADRDYLVALGRAETAHQPSPRVKVMQMIERRLRHLMVEA